MNSILEQEDPLEDKSAQGLPKQKSQVLFLPDKTLVPAGGRAHAMARPPGSRFNKPTKEDLEYYAETFPERQKFINDDPVVRSAKTNDPLATLAALKSEVAREAASLLYQRVQNEKMGKDITQISARRIDALKKMADIELDMHKIGFDHLDLHSEKFHKVFKFWIEIIRNVAEQVLSAENLDLFFNRLSTEMEGWEEKAEDLIR